MFKLGNSYGPLFNQWNKCNCWFIIELYKIQKGKPELVVLQTYWIFLLFLTWFQNTVQVSIASGSDSPDFIHLSKGSYGLPQSA